MKHDFVACAALAMEGAKLLCGTSAGSHSTFLGKKAALKNRSASAKPNAVLQG